MTEYVSTKKFANLVRLGVITSDGMLTGKSPPTQDVVDQHIACLTPEMQAMYRKAEDVCKSTEDTLCEEFQLAVMVTEVFIGRIQFVMEDKSI